MGINVGGSSGWGPKFPKRIVRRSPTQGFRHPAPYDPRTGHNLPFGSRCGRGGDPRRAVYDA